jgi:hypothetical protein
MVLTSQRPYHNNDATDTKGEHLMRFLTTLLVSVAAVSSAYATPWTDPSNTISLDTPAGWVVEPQAVEGLTYLVVASNASECHVVGVPRPSTADTTPYRMRAAAQQPLDQTLWTQIAGMFPDLFPGQTTVQSATVDTEPFWPIQRADFAVAGAAPVHGAIQFRPGLEVWALCRARNGLAEETISINSLFNSIGTPNDTALRHAAEREGSDAEEARRHSRTQALGDRGPIGSNWGTNTQSAQIWPHLSVLPL